MAGYASDNKTLFVDKYFKKHLTNFQFKLIILHEYIEFNILQNFKDFDYILAHQIAQQIEYAFYSEEEEIELQILVDDFEKDTLKRFHSKRIIVPLDLDITGYKQFGDDKLLEKCKKYTLSKKNDCELMTFKSKIG